ncbi:type II toxin-antitoxin system HicB family antitoxin [Aureimonas fodinaquatilis]|uniref:Type II toxin-antitoxin system HicB family antitoxin n=1 Tax=Aureimonas fodinaquatilis TaxID=2565783 RepID=A0A5B0DZX7_9HYPH|nr:type II toxin-antitoxin system HicB family antitoxin [Aureimonas fodinaquatilis]KAA0970779.1 type II toxin-antitoxin system HicB family antitoxin [Aureimonas fodinaquatilis]
MTQVFLATLVSDEDGFLVTFEDVPEAITCGKDEAEALASAREALGLALRGRVRSGDPMPSPIARSGVPVATAVFDTLKLATIAAFNEAGISKTELALLLGKQETEARRILDPMHWTKVQTLEEALTVLGKSVAVEISDIGRDRSTRTGRAV